jgi:predicted TIM-barrel fold metal-dependent hydrolase
MGRIVKPADATEDYPNLKIISHHCGAMVPSFSNRISRMFECNKAILKGGGF